MRNLLIKMLIGCLLCFAQLSYAQNKNGKAYYTNDEIIKLCGIRYTKEKAQRKLSYQNNKNIQPSNEHTNATLQKTATIPNWQYLMSPVENQSLDIDHNDCSAHAATGVIEGQLHKALSTNLGIDLDEDSFVLRAGNLYDYFANLEYIKTNKVYTDNGSFPNLSGTMWGITDYVGYWNNEDDLDALENGPLAAGFVVFDDMGPFFAQNPNGVYRHGPNAHELLDNGEPVGHAVVIVSYGTDAVGQYWICKNSWGSAWGMGGYFKIGYDEGGIFWGTAGVTVASSDFAKIVPNIFNDLGTALSNGFVAGEKAIVNSNITVTSNATIPSGGNLYIPTGKILTFSPSVLLTVNGILDATGTSFTGAGGGAWGGITFNSANGSSMNGCSVNYANLPITINSTYNLSISNCTIGYSSFSGDAAIRIYGSGSPVISSTQINGQSNSGNGIRFADNSTATLVNSQIFNCGLGNGIVIEGGANPIIDGNYIQGNHFHGIISVYGGAATYKGNMIINNGIIGGAKTYNGIHLLGSNGWIMGNTIQGNASGIYCDGASPTAFYPGGEIGTGGKNIISGNNYGIRANAYSNPIIGEVWGGEDQHQGTCNQIYNNVINSVYNVASVVIAERNWWSVPYEPYEPTDVANFNGGVTSTSSPLKSQYEAITFIPKIGILSQAITLSKSASMKDVLANARTNFIKKKYGESEKLYDLVIAESDCHDDIVAAINGLYRIYETTNNATLINSFEKLADGNSQVASIASQFLLRMYEATAKTEKMQNLFSTIQIKFPSSDLERHACLQMLISDRKNNKIKSSQAELSTPTIRRQFKSMDNGVLAALGFIPDSERNTSDLENTRILPTLENYPNPFNPSTTISYAVPQSGMVSLKVYDIMGREVASLVNEYKTQGRYNISFDAGRLSSGMYIYRIQAGSFTAVKKMNVVK